MGRQPPDSLWCLRNLRELEPRPAELPSARLWAPSFSAFPRTAKEAEKVRACMDCSSADLAAWICLLTKVQACAWMPVCKASPLLIFSSQESPVMGLICLWLMCHPTPILRCFGWREVWWIQAGKADLVVFTRHAMFFHHPVAWWFTSRSALPGGKVTIAHTILQLLNFSYSHSVL